MSILVYKVIYLQNFDFFWEWEHLFRGMYIYFKSVKFIKKSLNYQNVNFSVEKRLINIFKIFKFGHRVTYLGTRSLIWGNLDLFENS